MSKMKIELFRSRKTRKYYFRVRAQNGRIVAQSEGYSRRSSAERTAIALVVQLPNAAIVRRK